MKNVYLVGILIALSVLIVFGLSRLFPEFSGTKSDSSTQAFSAEDERIVDSITNEPVDSMQQEPATTSPSEATVAANADMTRVVIQTNKGDITVDLMTKDMPVTAGNFLKLAREDFYDGVKFHRIIDGFMIQGGDPLTKDEGMRARWGTGGPGYSIQDEFGPRASNARGTLSMANAGPNTGGSQFFINTADNTFLDGKHPVFGKVVAGMEVVDVLSKSPTGENDVPVEAVVMQDIVIK